MRRMGRMLEPLGTPLPLGEPIISTRARRECVGVRHESFDAADPQNAVEVAVAVAVAPASARSAASASGAPFLNSARRLPTLWKCRFLDSLRPLGMTACATRPQARRE